jgi:ubiquinone/menaquinone biosynthesis C-methylase UbiE
MSNAFDTTIQTYNKHASQFVKHFEKRLETLELDRFLGETPNGGYILDAGCGSARDAAYMMSKGYKVLGIDVAEGLLAEAKKLHPEVLTQNMNFAALTFPNNTFDGIWCKAALLHVERSVVPEVLEGFKRVLKPGGVLCIQTKEGIGEGTESAPFDPNVTRLFTYFTMEELGEMVKKVGFAITGIYSFNGAARGSREIDWVVVFAKKGQ